MLARLLPFAWLVAAGCAATKGDIRDNIDLRSAWAEPSRPPEPSKPPEPARPQSFPPVAVVWERASGERGDTLFASLTPQPSQSRPSQRTNIDTTPQPPKVVQSTGLARIPPLPPDATDAQRTFHDQASRAVIRITEQDYDDPSVAQSLREGLISKPELARMRTDWEQPLNDVIARAKTLQQLSPVLRQLRAAYANAKRDPKGFYRDIDQPACRQAFALLFDVGVEAVDTPVTVSPLSRMSLREIDALCRDSNEAILSERMFPSGGGLPALRKLVRRMYMQTYNEANVRRIVVPGNWREIDGGKRRTLRAVVGVQRDNAFPNDPCTMEEISISQKKSGRHFEQTECCDIHSTVAISCDSLE